MLKFDINFDGGKKNSNSAQSLPPKRPVNYTGERSYENDRNEEIEQLKEDFNKQIKRETDSRKDFNDENFYSAIVFTNAEQRLAFFQKLGVLCDPLTDLRFINGLALADLLGIDLPESSPLPPEKFKRSRAIMQLTHLPKPGTKFKK